MTSVRDSFHNSKLRIAPCICRSWSSTTLSCCKDIDAILFYLLFEERPEITMVTYQIDMTAQQLFQILGSLDIIEEFGRHGDKYIHIATFMVLIASN